MVDSLLWIASLIIALAGVTLLYWALFDDRACGRRRCPKCWYDMRAAAGLQCPECGHQAKREQKLLRTRRRWKWVWASVAFLAFAGLLALQPKVRRDGWGSVLPKTVLILALRNQNNQWAFEALDKRTAVEMDAPNPFATKMKVPDASTMWSWQWRMLSDICIHRLEAAMPAEKFVLIEWLNRSLDGLLDDDRRRVHDHLLAMLDDEEPAIRAKSAMFCAADFDEEKIVAKLEPLLEDQYQQVRIGAVMGLRLMARHSQAPILPLAHALTNDNRSVREIAASAFGSMERYFGNPPPDFVFDFLKERFQQDDSAPVAAACLRALCQFESRRDEASELLHLALRTSEDPYLLAEAIWIATASSAHHSLSLDELLIASSMERWMTHESDDVRLAASELFKRPVLSRAFKDHVGFLRRMALHDDMNVRRAANSHLRSLGEQVQFEK